jgi:hypothetical protein
MNNKYLFVCGFAVVMLSISISPLRGQIQRIGLEYSSSIRPNSQRTTGDYFVVGIPSNNGFLTIDFKIKGHEFTTFVGAEEAQYKDYYGGLYRGRGNNRSSKFFESYGFFKKNKLLETKYFDLNSHIGIKLLRNTGNDEGGRVSSFNSLASNIGNVQVSGISILERKTKRITTFLATRISMSRNILWDRMNLDLFVQYDYGFNQVITDDLYTTSTYTDFRNQQNLELIGITTQRLRLLANAIHYGLTIKWVI